MARKEKVWRMGTSTRPQRRGSARGAGRGSGDTRLAQAANAHRSGNLAGAETMLRKLMAERPYDAAVRHQLGILMSDSDRHAEAIEHLQAAVAAEPKNADYRGNLGNVYMSARLIDDAAKHYAEALAIDPDHPDSHYNMGTVCVQRREDDAAIEHFERTIALVPNHLPALVNLGLLHDRRGDTDGAVELLQRAQRADPRDIAVRYNIGRVLHEAARFEEAIEAYRATLVVNPKLAEAHLNLGAAYKALGRTAEATKAYKRATELKPTLALAMPNTIISTLIDLDALDIARTVAKASLAAGPNNIMAIANTALVQQAEGDFDGAVATFRQAIDLAPDNVWLLAHLPMALQYAGLSDEAAEIYDLDRLAVPHDFERVEGWESIEAFNADVAKFVYDHPTLVWNRPAKATRHGAHTHDLRITGNPVSDGMLGFVDRAIKGYIRDTLMAPSSPYRGPMPEHWTIDIWAIILPEDGYQSAHIHPSGFVSGVYYVQVPDAIGKSGDAGCIRFGQQYPEATDTLSQDGFLTRTFEPKPGRMVLFPSYFWHHTIPFESDQHRISVAFDAVPRDR